MTIARVYADAFIRRNKQLIQYSEEVKRELGAVHKKSSQEDHRHQGIRIGDNVYLPPVVPMPIEALKVS